MNKEKYFFDSYSPGEQRFFETSDWKKDGHRIRSAAQMFRKKDMSKKFTVKRVKVLTMAGEELFLRLRREA